jgi:hypothetical protein
MKKVVNKYIILQSDDLIENNGQSFLNKLFIFIIFDNSKIFSNCN